MLQGTIFDVLERPRPSPEPTPPHVAAETSREAAESMRGHAARLRGVVLDAIRAAGAAGLTTDEVEVATGLSHQTASPRAIELARAGLIVEARDDGGEVVKRKTRSGRRAVAWVASEQATG